MRSYEGLRVQNLNTYPFLRRQTPTPYARDNALKMLGVPAEDLRDEFSGVRGVHPLSIYESMPWLVSPGLSALIWSDACRLARYSAGLPFIKMSSDAYDIGADSDSSKPFDALMRDSVYCNASLDQLRTLPIVFVQTPAITSSLLSRHLATIINATLSREAIAVWRRPSVRAVDAEGWSLSQPSSAIGCTASRVESCTPMVRDLRFRLVTSAEVSSYVGASWNVTLLSGLKQVMIRVPSIHATMHTHFRTTICLCRTCYKLFCGVPATFLELPRMLKKRQTQRGHSRKTPYHGCLIGRRRLKYHCLIGDSRASSRYYYLLPRLLHLCVCVALYSLIELQRASRQE